MIEKKTKDLYMNITNRISKTNVLPICIGLVYLWFGSLKFFTSLSPAEDLAINTIQRLTMGLLPTHISIMALALWETIIGLLLILQIFKRQVIVMALIHISMTFTPLLFFPELIFNENMFLPTLLGQYIFKNIIIIGALLSLLKTNTLTYAKN